MAQFRLRGVGGSRLRSGDELRATLASSVVVPAPTLSGLVSPVALLGKDAPVELSGKDSPVALLGLVTPKELGGVDAPAVLLGQIFVWLSGLYGAGGYGSGYYGTGSGLDITEQTGLDTPSSLSGTNKPVALSGATAPSSLSGQFFGWLSGDYGGGAYGGGTYGTGSGAGITEQTGLSAPSELVGEDSA